MLNIIKENIWGQDAYYLKSPDGHHVAEVPAEIAHGLAKNKGVNSNFTPKDSAKRAEIYVRFNEGSWEVTAQTLDNIVLLSAISTEEVFRYKSELLMTDEDGHKMTRDGMMLREILHRVNDLGERLTKLEASVKDVTDAIPRSQTDDYGYD